MSMVDMYGRRISYLRLSVTGHCNLRCTYCRPEALEDALWQADVLEYDELLQVARAAVSLGVEKIRVTGGEPLMRPGITGLIADLAGLDGLKQLVLTTNGVLLAEMADELKQAGLQSINISLDSLDALTYAAITRGGTLQRVMDGIAAVERAGFRSVKINVVVMRGVNDHEVAEFAALTVNHPWGVRFIEHMPTLAEQPLMVPGEELLQLLSRRYELQPVDEEPLGGPSRNFRIKGATGTVSLITPLSNHFCHRCNRIRVTSSGLAQSCLFSDGGIDLKPFISDSRGLQAALLHAVQAKPQSHGLYLNGANVNGLVSIRMSSIGG